MIEDVPRLYLHLAMHTQAEQQAGGSSARTVSDGGTSNGGGPHGGRWPLA